MRYCEIRPAARLARHVECYWFLQGQGGGGTERILPDGCPELICNLGDVFHRVHEHHRERQARLLVSGQLSRFIVLEPSGRVDVMGIRFQPAGAWPFLRLPLRELLDQVIPIDDVAPHLSRLIADRVGPLDGIEERVRAIESLLLSLLAVEGGAIDPAVEAVTQQMLALQGALAIDAAAEQVGLSTRELERRFDRWVGLTPKALASVLRFQAVFRAVESDAPSWADTAVRCGYYDQAHLIKQFKRFAGKTPPRFFAEPEFFARAFARQKR